MVRGTHCCLFSTRIHIEGVDKLLSSSHTCTMASTTNNNNNNNNALPQKSLYDTLRSLSQRSLKRKRRDPIECVVQLAPTLLLTSSQRRNQRRKNVDAQQAVSTTKGEQEEAEASSTVKDEAVLVDVDIDVDAPKDETEAAAGAEETSAVDAGTSDDETCDKSRKKSKRAPPIWLADVERYEQRLERERAETQAVETARQQLLREQVELWGVYHHGLTKIAGLTDLSDAPDAILPGNFLT
jgi:hypothetical protein